MAQQYVTKCAENNDYMCIPLTQTKNTAQTLKACTKRLIAANLTSSINTLGLVRLIQLIQVYHRKNGLSTQDITAFASDFQIRPGASTGLRSTYPKISGGGKVCFSEDTFCQRGGGHIYLYKIHN